MNRTACGYGKLLLFGEHAAVYGYPAVGTALPQTVCLTHRRREAPPNSGAHRSEATDALQLGSLTVAGIPQPFHAAARRLFERLRELTRDSEADPELFTLMELSGEIDVSSDLPVSSGFGSSGAVCSALAQLALSERAETDPPPRHGSTVERRWHLAHLLEHEFHGTPSGVDTGLATFGDTRYFHFTETQRREAALPQTKALPDPKCALLAGAVPREGNTKELVSQVRRSWERNEQRTREEVAALGEIAENAAEQLSIPDAAAQAEALGTLADAAHQRLQSLGLSTVSLDQALALGHAHGATGGKLSGAGGGGAFYLLFRNASEAQEALQALQRELAAELTTAFLV